MGIQQCKVVSSLFLNPDLIGEGKILCQVVCSYKEIHQHAGRSTVENIGEE